MSLAESRFTSTTVSQFRDDPDPAHRSFRAEEAARNRDLAILWSELEAVADARSQPWREHAACRGAPHHIFFTEQGQTPAAAQQVCASCPVRQECEDFALSRREDHGVWAGLSVRHRRRIRGERWAASREAATAGDGDDIDPAWSAA